MSGLTLTNEDLDLFIDPNTGRWNVSNRHQEKAGLYGISMSLSTARSRHGQARLFNITGFDQGHADQTTQNPDRTPQIQLKAMLKDCPLGCQVSFSLANEIPLVSWQFVLTNHTDEPVYLRKAELLRVGFVTIAAGSSDQHLPSGNIQLAPKTGELAFFSNGWQSWTYTGAYRFYESARRTRLGILSSPMRVNAGTPKTRGRGHFTSEFFGILGDTTYRSAVLLGFLSQKQHFGTIEAYADPYKPALRMWANGDMVRLDPGATMHTDWACLGFLHIDTPDPLRPYLEAVAREHSLQPGSAKQIPAGWCSWYHYFQNISEATITDNLHTAAGLRQDLPLDLIQIDDGFEAQVGDWLQFKDSFPNGLAPLAKKIREAGFTPGLWLAPFIVHPKARLAVQHPDWLLRNSRGSLVNAGFIWNTFTHALDLTHPGALEYARKVIRTAVSDWGYPYLKLDFLYAAALAGEYQDQTRTRAQVLRSGLEALREEAGPETMLLGCGCPLGSALGLFEAMRISSDVSPEWHPRYFNTHFFFKPEPDFPSARNAIHNTLTRAPLHRRWWINDPDCLLVRPDSRLSLAEVRTLAGVIAMSGGSLFVSDDLTNLPHERLEIVRSLLPILGKQPYVIDWFDSATPTRLQIDLEGSCGRWHLLGVFNWSDSEANISLSPELFYLDTKQEYWAREFWSGELRRWGANGHTWKAVPAHGSLLLAVRPRRAVPQYLGSSLHFSQGLEVSRWEGSAETVVLVLDRPGKARGTISLHLPHQPVQAMLNQQPVTWKAAVDNAYNFPVEFTNRGELRLQVEAA
jgi:alpha-galactosidase